MGCKNIWEQLARLLLFGLRSSLSPLTSFFFSRFHFLIFTFFKKKNFFFYFLFFIYFFLISTIKRYWHQLQYPLSQLGVIADLDSQYFYLTSCCLSIVLISNDVSTMMSAGWRCSPDLILFRMNRKRKRWYYIKWYNFVSQFTTWRVVIGEDVLPHGPQTLFTSHNSPMWWFWYKIMQFFMVLTQLIKKTWLYCDWMLSIACAWKCFFYQMKKKKRSLKKIKKNTLRSLLIINFLG